MSRFNPFDISKAETIRYSKIQRMLSILNGDTNGAAADITDNLIASMDICPFRVGKRISIDGQTIKIGKKCWQSYEIQKVTANTEGSMAIYDRSGKKICGCLSLNVSLQNIELFCIWVRKYNIAAEIRSGKMERFFQYALLVITILLVLLYKMRRIIIRHIIL